MRRILPVLPGLASVLPDGGLRRGASHVIEGSTMLAAALLGAASREGSWIGVVGVPTFGVEAAAAYGVDLSRLALVPRPGPRWLNVVGTLVDTFDVVLLQPPERLSDGAVRRLSARLRERESALITLGPWPGSLVRLAVSDSVWFGLDEGHGRLRSRQVTVTTTGRGSAFRSRSQRLWLPDADGGVRPIDPATTHITLDATGLDYHSAPASTPGPRRERETHPADRRDDISRQRGHRHVPRGRHPRGERLRAG